MAGPAGHGHGTSYAGFHPHPPSRLHVYLAKAIGASMWFWIFYRARQDGPKLLGWRHPWEGHHGDSAHGGEHAHGPEHH